MADVNGDNVSGLGVALRNPKFDSGYDPFACLAVGEIGVVGVNSNGKVRGQVFEIADRTKIKTIPVP